MAMKSRKRRFTHLPAILLGTLAISAAAYAETRAVSPTGFIVHLQRDVPAPSHQVYEAIGSVGKWWNSAHTWSGNAANLSMELKAGGCFCERWNGNSVMHGQVIVVRQNEELSLQSSLGPLQQLAVSGILTFATKSVGGKTALTLTYRVAGNAESGLDKWAPAVDKVLLEQLTRLVALIETGQPAPSASSQQ